MEIAVVDQIPLVQRIALGFKDAAKACGMSVRFMQLAADDPDPARRLKTVRVSTRRLIRPADLEEWFNRVSRDHN